MKRNAERPVQMASDLGQSCGFSISAMKVGNRICGTHRKVFLSTAFMAATKVVPLSAKIYLFTRPCLGKLLL